MKTALILLGLILGIAPPAQADSPGYVTRHEYHRVQAGMTKQRVQSIFDTHGLRVRASGTRQKRFYRGWRPTIQVFVRYRREGRRWRVVEKYAQATTVSP